MAVVWALHSVGVQREKGPGMVMIYDNRGKEAGMQGDPGFFGAELKRLYRASSNEVTSMRRLVMGTRYTSDTRLAVLL